MTFTSGVLTAEQKNRAVDLFKSVQSALANAFEATDGTAKVQFKPWQRDGGGGGTIGLMRGQVVEKAAANVSAVTGDKYPAIEGEHKDKPFFAAGVSTITHMYNPHAPIAHMNVRLLEVGETFWVGGGGDLTPFIKYEEDKQAFHAALREACETRGPEVYDHYRQWCDEYFFIPHRKEIRGVGGIFFDYLKGDFDSLLAFLEKVAFAYVRVYPQILQRRKDQPYTPEDKDGQLFWRARYAEFNLAYDRGTRFGLMTGGNAEAILCSMPPVVKW